MDAPVIILYLFIISTTVVRLSLLPKKVAIAAALLWGAVAFILTMSLSSRPLTGIRTIISDSKVLLCLFADISAMLCFCIDTTAGFMPGFMRKFLHWYPGLMIWLPIVSAISVLLTMSAGIPFDTLGVMTGVSTAVIILSAVAIVRHIPGLAGKLTEILYILSIGTLLTGIVISGV